MIPHAFDDVGVSYLGTNNRKAPVDVILPES